MDKRQLPKKTPQPQPTQKAAREADLPVAKSLKNKSPQPVRAKPVGQTAQSMSMAMAARGSGRRGERSFRGLGVIAAAGAAGVLLVVVLVIANLYYGDRTSAITPNSLLRETQDESKKTGNRLAANNHSEKPQPIVDDVATADDAAGAATDAATDDATDDANAGNTSPPETRPSEPPPGARRSLPFPDSLKPSAAATITIRQALSRRDMAAARKYIAQLGRSTDDVEITAQLTRARTVYHHLANFWAIAITTARQSGAGDQLQYAGSKYVVTSVDAAAIRVRAGRIDKRYAFNRAHRDMPVELAMAFCAAKLRGGDPLAMLYAGTFLAVDQNGSLLRARMLCSQALHQGVDCEAVLFELKLDSLDSLAVVDRSELSALFAVAAPTVRKPVKQAAQTVDARLPIPSDTDQKKSLEKIRSIFESEYSAAKSIDDQIALASKLFEQAKATAGDAAARWVLLAETRRLTTLAGDVPLLISAVAQQAEHYRVDLLKEKSNALQQLPSKARSLRSKSLSKRKAAVHSIVKQLLSTADEAITADEYGIALQLSRLAATVARKVKDSSLIRLAAAGQKEVRELERQWQTAEKARGTLEKNSTDPLANYRLGRYLCLIKGSWDEGLPLLAQGSSMGLSAALRRVAKADLTNPTRTDHRVKLADAWWKLAQTAQPREKSHLSRRARSWYSLALEKAAGLDKVAVEKRLNEIDVVLAQTDGGESSSGGNQLIVPLGSGVTMKFQLMPRGQLPSGSNTKPTTIARPYYIGVTEVTQAQWRAVMGNIPNRSKPGPRLPVTRISWGDCNRFVEKLNVLGRGKYRFRIPTESEWEYACRAGTTTTYFFGDDSSQMSQYAWFKKNSGETTHPVASLKPNPAGLYDITGNVWEWCQGGILRGGCYHKTETQCKWRTRSDYSARKSFQTTNIGLRLVCDS